MFGVERGMIVFGMCCYGRVVCLVWCFILVWCWKWKLRVGLNCLLICERVWKREFSVGER